MKKMILTLAFFALSFGANAQQDNMDQLQQQPPRETQAAVEKAATRDAKKTEAETKQKEAEERKAKEAEEKAKIAAQKEDEAAERRANKAKNKSQK